jgi:translation initiation factor 2B subunit (eIF-2B alpha/beta/delta family)
MRVNIDQIKGNEVGDPLDISHSYINKNSKEDKDKLARQKNLDIRYLKYDFTAARCIQMILCELGHGRLSPVSVPVVIKEFEMAAMAE